MVDKEAFKSRLDTLNNEEFTKLLEVLRYTLNDTPRLKTPYGDSYWAAATLDKLVGE